MSVKRSRISGHSASDYPQQPAYDSPVIPEYDPDTQDYNDGHAMNAFSRSTGSQKRNSSSQPNYPPPTFAQPSRYDPSQHSLKYPGPSAKVRDTTQDSSYYSNTGRRVASEPMGAGDRGRYARADAGDNHTASTPRRASVSHKSPLQKLEGTFDSMSKEERRARVAEAELAVQDKVSRTGSRGYGRRDSVERRHVRADSGASIPPPIADNRYRGGNYSAMPANVSQYQSGRTAALGEVDSQVPQASEYRRAQNTHKALASSALNNTRYADEPDYAPAPPPKDIPRADSRRLQKNPPKNRVVSAPERSPAVLNTNLQSHSADRRGRDQLNGSSPAANSVYHTPPQHAVDKHPHRSVDFDNTHAGRDRGAVAAGAAAAAAPTQHGFRLPHVFHRHREGRRYAEGPVVSDWKQVPTASLSAADLDLASARPHQPTEGPDDRPWWEKSSVERTKSSTRRNTAATAYGPNIDARSGQTYFRPPIYLKCGPLLRFRGIYSESSGPASTSASSSKEFWRGSIMIVTVDSKSKYQTAPTLRLFGQPVHLLPPPPSEVKEDKGQELSPDYVDPIAGQVKASRVGKTLYVRPVEHLDVGVDLSRKEDDNGLFEEKKHTSGSANTNSEDLLDGEKAGKVTEVQGARLFAERGCTFWKFNVEIELGTEQQRIAYRINRGPAIGFWVPARGQNMNIMFHSCNGFSLSVNTAEFSGPDPLWRDVLNSHQTRPFHVMLGGGDQIYMDAATRNTKLFKEWIEHKNPHHKHSAPFTEEMQEELEKFYLDRYAMWFSSGFFGMANSQIPMVNVWDDHDIIDGYGSYPDSLMSCPVFTGVGAVAYKYYMLFQHQTVPEETEVEEPSWILGFQRGPYIQQRSRSVFMNLGSSISFLGLDCRTERTRDLILSEQSWEHAFQRLETELVKGKTKHLLVLLGVPIAYPRINFLENVLTSRMMNPVKAIGRTGALGGFVNKFDGGVEILDDLDDHWTAKHHKDERNWFIQELQYIAAAKSVRITILGGDVHLAAVGRFFSNGKLNIPKDRDHRYMPNVISSAIVNTPPGDMVADVLNKRDKIHHLDDFTDENMIPLFTVDTDGKPRNNKTLLPRRNWCSIRDYVPSESPIASPHQYADQRHNDISGEDRSSIHTNESRRSRISLTDSIRRSFSETRQKITGRIGRSKNPPMAFYNKTGGVLPQQRTSSADAIMRRGSQGSVGGYGSDAPGSAPANRRSFSINDKESVDSTFQRPNKFARVPTGLSEKQARKDVVRGGAIDLTDGLTIHINAENVRGDPAGTTTDYHFMVPALDFRGEIPALPDPLRKAKGLRGLFGSMRRVPVHGGSIGGSDGSIAGTDLGEHERRAVNPDALNGWADEDHQGAGHDHGHAHHSVRHAAASASAAVRPVDHKPRQSLDEGLYISRVRNNKVQTTTASAAAAAATAGAATAANEPERHPSVSHTRKPSRTGAMSSAAITSGGAPAKPADTTRLADGRQIRHPHHPAQQQVSDLDLAHDRAPPRRSQDQYAPNNTRHQPRTYVHEDEDDLENGSLTNVATQQQKLQEHRKKRGSFAAKAREAVRGGLAYARGPRRRYPEDFEDDYYTDEEEADERYRRSDHQHQHQHQHQQTRPQGAGRHYSDDSYAHESRAGAAAATRHADQRDGGNYRRDGARANRRVDYVDQYSDEGDDDDGYDSPSQEVGGKHGGARVASGSGGGGTVGGRKSSWKFWKNSSSGAVV